MCSKNWSVHHLSIFYAALSAGVTVHAHSKWSAYKGGYSTCRVCVLQSCGRYRVHVPSTRTFLHRSCRQLSRRNTSTSCSWWVSYLSWWCTFAWINVCASIGLKCTISITVISFYMWHNHVNGSTYCNSIVLPSTAGDTAALCSLSPIKNKISRQYCISPKNLAQK